MKYNNEIIGLSHVEALVNKTAMTAQFLSQRLNSEQLTDVAETVSVCVVCVHS